MFKAQFNSPNGLDAFDLKSTVSDRSMDRDSAYQSQSGRSQRGATRPDGNHWMPTYEFSAMNNQFPGGNLPSPMLGSDNSTPFSENRNFNPMVHAEGLDTSWNTDASAEQVMFSSFTNTNSNQNVSHMQSYPMDYSSWDTPTTGPLMPFTPYDAQHDVTSSMFDMPPLSQPQQSTSMISAPAIPAMVHSSPSFAAVHDPRRASTQSVSMSAYVTSPPSMVHAQLQDGGSGQQRHAESRIEQEDDARQFLPTPSINEEDDALESLSPGEAKKYEEERTKSARTHPLYQTLPDADGMYACPFQAETKCPHKRTNLKCNFDKFLDSHIKPFRCKREKCDDVKFSSTACLLRHERENHGMHGHGDRPHLCYFADCDRSIAGHGFPRRYNAFDHMKRVHGWKGDSTNASSPPKGGPAPGTRKVAGRKRKATTEEVPSKRKARTTDPKPTGPSDHELLEQQRIGFREAFSRRRAMLIDTLSRLSNPDDLDQATEDQLRHALGEMFDAATAHKQCSG
ncbi:hypothetical protein K458DRAFT_203789 [Lentithecium fluviatile CBS 122367]|uniref:C2H2-type domain-containing protein n=1 Tax=Lentithecium fluviatile CBS 122367 TaxID=1168545 RepID=A0A6G1J9F7_9PLEO|nr:hypothetical protein K458DRAFT_203789 [Lentithecium fluviatile CBS 122367]